MRYSRLSSAMAILVVGILLTPIGAHAVEDYSDEEAALLPTWCEVYRRTGNLRPSDARDTMVASRLAAFIRQGCGGHHHYCWALATANRALFFRSDNPNAQAWQLKDAMGDFNYVLRNSKNTCPLVPDMHTKSGEWHTLIGNYKEAEKRLRQAIAIRPDYAPAYVGLSDLFETQDKPDEALAALQQGLKANPKSAALKKKLDRLQQRIAKQPLP